MHKKSAAQKVANSRTATHAVKLQTAIALHQRGDLAEAEAIYKEVLQSQPRNVDALHFLALIAYQRKNYNDAVVLFEQALTIIPHHISSLNNYGLALLELKCYSEALKCYDKAIFLKTDYAQVYFNRGNVLQHLKHYEEALASYDKAIALKADYAQAFFNRGNVLLTLKQYAMALISFDSAIALKANYAEVFCNRSIALKELNRYEEALLSLDKAIALKADYPEAYSNRGNALQELKRYNDALGSFKKALEINADGSFWFGAYQSTKMRICNWENFDNDVRRLFEKIEHKEKALVPFAVLATVDAPSLQKEAALIFVEARHPSQCIRSEMPKYPRHNKIRIGYYSADFCNHAVSLLTAELYEMHDRSLFEITAFSFGSGIQDHVRQRIENAVDTFIDVRNISDNDVALKSRNLEIDIAIDLGGFTKDFRTGIFALRAAPIQASYIGYLGTMGAEYIDYIIADEVLIPADSQKYYTEKIAYIPSYQANDSKRQIADRVFTRAELGLPPSGFVFCCFNNNYKITPGTFGSWMRILNAVDGSVLFLYADNDLVKANLQKEAAKRGVDANRLVFGKRLPTPEYIARYRTADLFLDTFPYNAGATASDALWAGLPVLTCIGKSFASRIAASLLTAIDLPELITTTQDDYEALAIELATHPDRLDNIRRKLEKNRLTTPLFDTSLFTKHIEEAYTTMYERYQADLPPDHIYSKE